MATISELTLGVFPNDPYAPLLLGPPLAVSTHPNPRARIRAWALARLRQAAAQPTRILVNRARFAGMTALPALLLYTLQEDDPIEDQSSPRLFEHTLQLAVQSVIAPATALPTGVALDDVVDALDHVSLTVLLSAWGPPGAFGGQARAVVPGPLAIEYEDEGERPLLHARRVLTVTYLEGYEVADLRELELANVKYDLGPEPDGQIEAEDAISIEQGDP